MENSKKIPFKEITSENLLDGVVVTLCEFLDCYLTCPKCIRNNEESCTYNETKVVIPTSILPDMSMYLPPDERHRTMLDLSDEQIKEMAFYHKARCGA
jgi:hypothetical protein